MGFPNIVPDYKYECWPEDKEPRDIENKPTTLVGLMLQNQIFMQTLVDALLQPRERSPSIEKPSSDFKLQSRVKPKPSSAKGPRLSLGTGKKTTSRAKSRPRGSTSKSKSRPTSVQSQEGRTPAGNKTPMRNFNHKL
jgi:hypothetical protein